MASTLPRLPLFEAISKHDPDSTAVIHAASWRHFKYGGLLRDVANATDSLRKQAGRSDLAGERIAFLVENGYDYVVTLLSILGSDAIAVPLSPSFPANELRYILESSGALMLLSSTRFKSKLEDVVKEGLEKTPIIGAVEKLPGNEQCTPTERIELEEIKDPKGGMMLYTSGTTNRPKGVLLSQSVLTAQASSLLRAWKYSPSDHLLHVLPLHHIHGTVNALISPLLAGSTMEFLFPFNAALVWERLANPFLSYEASADFKSPRKPPITFLTVVPTIYNRLLAIVDQFHPVTVTAFKKGISPQHMRLNISGSAALPTPTKKAWQNLSDGNVLLERYGMTEVGMALSCGLDFADRIDGSVGWPLPSVEARLVDTETNEVIPVGEETGPDGKQREGEIQLRGPTVFHEYWRNEKATAEEFVAAEDGSGEKWFKTGDVATRRSVDGAGKGEDPWARGPMYFILGRNSVDIIKTGGEKVSALEVERELLSLPQIAEAAVVGLPSETWGQKVAAVVTLEPELAHSGRGGKAWGLMDMRRAMKDRLANYKIPQELKVLGEGDGGIPRNAMGKVNKKGLVREVWGDLTLH